MFTDFFSALSEFQFLQYALIAGCLASLGCGFLGVYVVVKRLSFLAGGIAHAVLGGMGAALFYGFSPFYGALISAIIAALLIGWISLYKKENEDTLISAVWATGMAIGLLFIAAKEGYSIDLNAYLFGDILVIGKQDLILIALLDVFLIGSIIMFYRPFLAMSFDEEFSRIRGLPTTFLYLFLLVLIAISVVLLIRVVGLILVIVLLTLPAAIAGQYSHVMYKMMIIASFLGVLFCSTGIMLSYQPDLPSGAVIVLITGSAYLFSTIVVLPLSQKIQRWRK